LIFVIASRQNPADAFAYTNDTKGFVFGPHPVKAPDTKHPEISEGFPEGYFNHLNKFYNYTLRCILGSVDYFWLILEPGVIVENVAISNPGWQWYHNVEEGLLLFDTLTNPLNETNPQVSMGFSSPNSIEGEVGALANGFGGQIVGPVLPTPVGGFAVLIDKPKPDLSGPYIGLASSIIVATVATAIYVKRVRHRKKKQ